MKRITLVILSIMIINLLLGIVAEIDHKALNDRIYNSVFYNKDCGFDLSGTGYYLATLNGRYIICKEDYGVQCLTGYQVAGISCIYPGIKPPCTFKDSCSAKGYLAAFLKEESEKNIEPYIKKVNLNR